MMHQRFRKGLQTDNRDVKMEPTRGSLGNRTGGGVSAVEDEVYNGANFIAFLPRKIDNRGDRH